MLYLDVSAYQNLSKQTLEVLGEPGISDLSIGGVAPYWRAAFEYNLGEQSFEIGTFGMFANQLPGRVKGFGFDQTLDVGFDAQYQYIGDPHSVTIKLTHIHENQQLNSTFWLDQFLQYTLEFQGFGRLCLRPYIQPDRGIFRRVWFLGRWAFWCNFTSKQPERPGINL